MASILVIISIIVCVLLGLIILIQNPKGGGLSSGFAGSNNIMGVQRTGDFLEKGTWGLVIALMVLALLINVTAKPDNAAGSNYSDQIVPSSKPFTPLPGTLPSAQPTATDSTKK